MKNGVRNRKWCNKTTKKIEKKEIFFFLGNFFLLIKDVAMIEEIE